MPPGELEGVKMYNVGDVIDGKYRVESTCSDEGGMGVILHVAPVAGENPGLVLKYCKHADEKLLKRFRREVRMLGDLSDSPLVAQLHDANPDHDPPYYVMKFYPDGDLATMGEELRKPSIRTIPASTAV